MEAVLVEGGFAAPVLDAQRIFRTIMDAMAQPGSLHTLHDVVVPPAPLMPTAGAIALTLCDHDSPVWLDSVLRASNDVTGWLRFHAGPPLAETPAAAHFAFIADAAALVTFDSFSQGTQDYPDRSTTLILQVESLNAGMPLLLEGPGIKTMATLAPTPMPRYFGDQWKQNNARFPRGVDLILAGPGTIACLPRTTRISFREE